MGEPFMWTGQELINGVRGSIGDPREYLDRIASHFPGAGCEGRRYDALHRIREERNARWPVRHTPPALSPPSSSLF